MIVHAPGGVGHDKTGQDGGSGHGDSLRKKTKTDRIAEKFGKFFEIAVRAGAESALYRLAAAISIQSGEHMDTWLIFFLLCFAGIVFMFYCMLRRQDALLKTMRDEHTQIRVMVQALSARLDAGTGFGELEDYGGEYDRYDAGGREASPGSLISVDEALDAYIRKERQDPDKAREPGKDGLPDLEI
jgi:hypothetical protein